MIKFVLMQEPAKWIGESGYSTIGLEHLYPKKGYSSCDEYGYTDYIGPKEGIKIVPFAFLDNDTEKEFKGETKNCIDPETGTTFKCAVVKLKGGYQKPAVDK